MFLLIFEFLFFSKNLEPETVDNVVAIHARQSTGGKDRTAQIRIRQLPERSIKKDKSWLRHFRTDEEKCCQDATNAPAGSNEDGRRSSAMKQELKRNDLVDFSRKFGGNAV
jgi:hypothetical protein